MFTREFLQAVSDWQRGGDARQTKKRGERLKELAEGIDSRFRSCGLVTYRQVALDNGGVWKLIAERSLPEKISAWTLAPSIAKTFKGGVPPEGWQGVIFEIMPEPGSVIVNLHALYQASDFRAAMERESSAIDGFWDGAGRYGNTQAEVVLSIENLDRASVHALGGYSSDRDTLIRMMFDQEPTEELITWFETQQKKASIELGAFWLDGEPLQRVLNRMEPHIARLKPIKAAQDEAKKAAAFGVGGKS